MHVKQYFQTVPKTDLIGIGAFAVLFAVSAAVAGWTPEDILSRPWARTYVDFMARLIPAVERVREFSPFPSVAQFYFSVMWLTVPVMFGINVYAGIKGPEHRRNEVLRKVRGKYRWSAIVIILPFFLYYGFYIKFFGHPPGPRLIRLLVSSKFGLGLVGAFEFIAMPMLAAFWVIVMLNCRLLLRAASDT